MPYYYIGSTKEVDANRVKFGQAVSDVLDKHTDRKKDVMVIDSDLEGSTGLKVIHQRHPECFVPSGIMVGHDTCIRYINAYSEHIRNEETCLQPLVLASTRTRLASSLPSLLSWR